MKNVFTCPYTELAIANRSVELKINNQLRADIAYLIRKHGLHAVEMALVPYQEQEVQEMFQEF